MVIYYFYYSMPLADPPVFNYPPPTFAAFSSSGFFPNCFLDCCCYYCDLAMFPPFTTFLTCFYSYNFAYYMAIMQLSFKLFASSSHYSYLFSPTFRFSTSITYYAGGSTIFSCSSKSMQYSIIGSSYSCSSSKTWRYQSGG